MAAQDPVTTVDASGIHLYASNGEYLGHISASRVTDDDRIYVVWATSGLEDLKLTDGITTKLVKGFIPRG